jgi:hypothetical protein
LPGGVVKGHDNQQKKEEGKMASFAERVIGAAKLDVQIYEEVEVDVNATGQALAVVLISAVSGGLAALRGGMGTGVVFAVIASLVAWFIWAFLTFLIGTKLMPEPQTQADLGQLLRTIGFASAPGILGILGAIPFIGLLISLALAIWMLIAMVVAVRQALDYRSTGRAVIVCLIGWIVNLIIQGIFLGFSALGGLSA